MSYFPINCIYQWDSNSHANLHGGNTTRIMTETVHHAKAREAKAIQYGHLCCHAGFVRKVSDHQTHEKRLQHSDTIA